MPYQENELFANRYKLVHKLGVGGFSEVWLANDEYTDDSQVALKIYAPNGGLDNQGLKIFSKEYALLQDINNQYLLKAMHFDVNNDMPYLILPYCPNGSLLGQLQDKGNFSEEELATVIFQVCTGLAYLHENGIIHQDIKPANILINKRNEYVISDFGISNNVRRTLRKSMGVTSSSMSPEYAPPERFSSNPKTVPAGDVFSFGVLMYEMATGDVPWMGMGGMSLSRGAEIPSMPDKFSNLFKKWSTACLAIKPEERPEAKDLANAANTFLKEGFWPPLPVNTQKTDKPKASARKTVAQVDLGQMAAQIDENLKKEATKESASKPKAGAATIKDGAPKKTGTKKKSPVLAIIIVLILIIGGGAAFWWYNNEQNNQYYAELIQNAAALETDSNWLEASVAYHEAETLRPADTTGANGYKRVLSEMKIIVDGVISEADELANDKKYMASMETLERVADYEEMFTEIAEARSNYEALAQEQREAEFKKNMDTGDKYLAALTYAKAAEYFGRADSIMPGDPRVQEKLNSIGSKLKELYAGEISKGDSYMASKNYAAAISAYSRAILYDKTSTDGKAKLAKAKEGYENNKKLLAAAENNNLSDVKSLLAAGADVNINIGSKCPISWAVYNNNLDMVKALKASGANCEPDMSMYGGGRWNYSLIYLAGAMGHLDVFKYIQSSCGASISGVYEITSSSAIKDYLKTQGYGSIEYVDYFTSESSSSFNTDRTENREWTFRDGKFYVRCIKEGFAGWNGEDFDDIDINDDWEMSIDVYQVSGNTGDGGLGLLFAADNSYSHVNVFGITQGQKYHIGHYAGSWDTEYIDNTTIKTGKISNNIKVVKKGSTVYYYINGAYITSKYGVKMAGNTFGFYYGSSEGFTTAWFDNFKLTQL